MSNNVKTFEERLKEQNFMLKATSGNEKEVCQELEQLRTRGFVGSPFKEKNIKKRFIHSLRKLNPDLIEFYVANNFRIVRDNTIQNGIVKLGGDKDIQELAITSRPLQEVDFTSIAYRLGEIPGIVNNYKDEYYDYQKAFPIFLEYLACKELDKENGKDIFMDIRLDKSKSMASFYLSYDELASNNQREVFRYISSLEFVLELLDRIKEDREVVNDELSKYVLESKSLREVGESLGIDTSGCKRLLKEINTRKQRR